MDYQNSEIAGLYDIAHPRAEDTDFYLSLAGRHPRSVLDLGCGTGTLCCDLAAQGHEVTGVDPAAAMLALAVRKPYADRVEWVESTAQNFRSNGRFDLIVMTGHAFQVLLSDDDAQAALETMRRHLNDGGRIAFETRNPQMDWVGEWSARSPRSLPGGQFEETLKIVEADAEFITFETCYRSADHTITTSSTLRFRSREQVEKLIARSGLLMLNVLGDWAGGPFDPERSCEIICLAQVGRAGF